MKLNTAAHVPGKEIPKDSYVVEIQSMQGDADGYTKLKVGPFKKDKEEANLQSLLETLKRMKSEFSYDTGFKNILGFEQWFGEAASFDDMHEWFPELLEKFGTEASQQIIDLSKNHSIEWPNDPTSDYQTPEHLDKYKVFYYDAEGKKFKVEIDWEE